jgi:hypothetical protein
MQLIIDVAYWLVVYNDDMQHIAGFFCILKFPAHLTIRLMLNETPPPTDSEGWLLPTIYQLAYHQPYLWCQHWG